MEQMLKDVMNAGIALFRTGEDKISGAMQEMKQGYEELISKGAADNSEQAEQLRNILNDIVSRTGDLKDKADQAYDDAVIQIQEQYKNLVEQIETVIPPERMNEFKDKIEELTRVLKEKTGLGKANASEEVAVGTAAGAGNSESSQS